MEAGCIRTVIIAPPPHYYSKHDWKYYSRNNFRGRTGSHNHGCQWWMVTGTESFQLGQWQSTPTTLFWKRITSAQWFQICIVVTEQNLTPCVGADKIPSVFVSVWTPIQPGQRSQPTPAQTTVVHIPSPQSHMKSGRENKKYKPSLFFFLHSLIQCSGEMSGTKYSQNYAKNE